MRLVIGADAANTFASIHLADSSTGLLLNKLSAANLLSLESSISSDEAGLMVYDKSTQSAKVWTGSAWTNLDGTGTQGPAGSSAFLGKPIDQTSTATGNELLQYKASAGEWKGVTSPDGLTIDAGTY